MDSHVEQDQHRKKIQIIRTDSTGMSDLHFKFTTDGNLFNVKDVSCPTSSA